jgi:N-terminal half of MaoC dehydratase
MTVERFPVERGHVMMFARAIGDHNPAYFAEEGAIAPPTFVIADMHFDPDSRLRPHPDRPWPGSGRNPTSRPAGNGDGGGRAGMGLHAEESFEIRRPVRVGEVLTKTTRPGKTWEREGRRGGKLRFSETLHEYRDSDGELVVIARQVGVQTERNPDA